MQVGIPTSDACQWTEIIEEFFNYRSQAQNLWDDYSAHEHWAKTEVPILLLVLRFIQTLLASFPASAPHASAFGIVVFSSLVYGLCSVDKMGEG
jgi:hypothetical protein